MQEHRMNIEKAHLILKSLADGVDPITGWVLAADHPCQQPETIRALFLAASVLERDVNREQRLARARLGMPVNTGKSWSVGEEAMLLKRYSGGNTVQELAELHRRTVGSICARLEKLGQMQVATDPAVSVRPMRAS
jgi:hypothetical protein